jgi:hypothetical protein
MNRRIFLQYTATALASQAKDLAAKKRVAAVVTMYTDDRRLKSATSPRPSPARTRVLGLFVPANLLEHPPRITPIASTAGTVGLDPRRTYCSTVAEADPQRDRSSKP